MLSRVMKFVRNLTKKQVIVVCAVVAAVTCASGVAIAASLHDNDSSSSHRTPQSSKSSNASTSTASTSTGAAPTSAETTQTTVAATAKNTDKTSAVSGPSAAKGVEFSLSTNSLTAASGTVTAAVTATSTNGIPLAWNAAPNDPLSMVVQDGWLFKSPEISHTYTMKISSATKPGIYTFEIMGYIPKGQQVRKTVTVTVTQGPTFKLTALQPDYAYDTATTFDVPFLVEMFGPTPKPTSFSAVIVNANGVPMQVGNVLDMPGGYGLKKQVVIYDNGMATGTIVVRVTAGDGIYTTSLDIPYDVQTL